MGPKPPRYDLPNAAPEPLRLVQRFVNTIDLSHDREWLTAWLEEQGLDPASDADLDRARTVREAIRELLYANNGHAVVSDPLPALDAAAGAARLTIDFAGPALVPTAGGNRRRDRTGARRLPCDHGRRDLEPPQVLPQPRVPLVLLRLLEEPLGDLVLDADLRQPHEDEGVPAPLARGLKNLQSGGLSPDTSGQATSGDSPQTRPSKPRPGNDKTEREKKKKKEKKLHDRLGAALK